MDVQDVSSNNDTHPENICNTPEELVNGKQVHTNISEYPLNSEAGILFVEPKLEPNLPEKEIHRCPPSEEAIYRNLSHKIFCVQVNGIYEKMVHFR